MPAVKSYGPIKCTYALDQREQLQGVLGGLLDYLYPILNYFKPLKPSYGLRLKITSVQVLCPKSHIKK